MLPNRLENVFCNVSVRTNVPAMNVTPSTIANDVSAKRSLWAKRPLIVTFFISGPLCPKGLHALQDRSGGGLLELADHFAVRQEHHPVRIGGTVGVMGHHYDRLTQLVDGPAQEPQ